MLRQLGLLALVFTITIGCQKKKPEENQSVDPTANDASVTSQPMNFDTAGSDSGNIPGLNTIYFAYDDSRITEESQKLLAQNAEWIKKNPNIIMQIEGHCDQKGSIEYNLALGERRAKSVKAYLASLGVDSKKMTVISYGKEKLITTGESEADMARNRRANFVPINK